MTELFRYIKYTFTSTWFKGSEIRKLIPLALDPTSKNTILEIGSYEGASACYFSDHFLDHPQSTLTCIDPFNLQDTTSPIQTTTMNTFKSNMNKSKNAHKVTLMNVFSSEYYKSNPSQLFNFIYIDGSHLPSDIIIDFDECFKLLEVGGIMWLDDYACNSEVKDCIDKLSMKYVNQLSIIHQDYQIAYRKISN